MEVGDRVRLQGLRFGSRVRGLGASGTRSQTNMQPRVERMGLMV